MPHGTITIAPKQAQQGKSVNIIPKPDKGYELVRIAVLDVNGKELALAEKKGHNSFTMPACTVTVKATFRAVGSRQPFKDVEPGDWFYESVLYAYDHDLMGGTGDDAFCPGGTAIGGMLVTVLWNLEGRPTAEGELSYADVSKDAYCARAVMWAVQNGIAVGYGRGIFGPDDPVSREQAVVMLFNYARFKGYDTSVGEEHGLSGFRDRSAVSDFARPAMGWGIKSGVIEGRGDGILDPGGEVTRGQTAKMLCNFCEKGTD